MKTIKKYKHFLPVVVYGIFYLKCFQYLETHITKGYHLIHTPFDDMVPFCEFFVIPYFMWFGFIAWSVLYFGLCNKNRREYYQLIINLGIGMTVKAADKVEFFLKKAKQEKKQVVLDAEIGIGSPMPRL